MPDEPKAEPKAKKAEPTLVQLRHESDVGDFVLTIGDTSYVVSGGVVLVAPEHVEAARLAGFR